MNKLRFYVAMGMVISVTLSVQGCFGISFHSYKPVDILVLDAETNNPIANATVEVRYAHGEIIEINHPENISGTTDEIGRLTLEVANYKLDNVIWDITADGYLATGGSSRRDRVPKEFMIESSTDDNSEKALVTMYREPMPKVSIVVPDGYRGRMIVKFNQIEEIIPGSTGKREFEFIADQDGKLTVDIYPLMRTMQAYTLHFKYNSGEELPYKSWYYEKAEKEAIGLYRMGSFGLGSLFLIGTEDEAKALHQLITGQPKNDWGYNSAAVNAVFEEDVFH